MRAWAPMAIWASRPGSAKSATTATPTTPTSMARAASDPDPHMEASGRTQLPRDGTGSCITRLPSVEGSLDVSQWASTSSNAEKSGVFSPRRCAFTRGPPPTTLVAEERPRYERLDMRRGHDLLHCLSAPTGSGRLGLSRTPVESPEGQKIGSNRTKRLCNSGGALVREASLLPAKAGLRTSYARKGPVQRGERPKRNLPAPPLGGYWPNRQRRCTPPTTLDAGQFLHHW